MSVCLGRTELATKTPRAAACSFYTRLLPCKVVRHARVGERAVEFKANEEFVVIVPSI